MPLPRQEIEHEAGTRFSTAASTSPSCRPPGYCSPTMAARSFLRSLIRSEDPQRQAATGAARSPDPEAATLAASREGGGGGIRGCGRWGEEILWLVVVGDPRWRRCGWW
uniref:Uncharacterized protein n=1 Tax=Oryza meridionalis TaxID=40149 RepID=A0A0E0EVL7_9ORYZ